METQLENLTSEGIGSSLDFRLFLQEEYSRRRRKNSAYSIRAFAKMLGIENSALSKILSGKRSVSKSMMDRFAKRLDLGPKELGRFQVTQKSLVNYHQMTLDQFAVISDWHHFAILELMRLKDFKSDDKWMARALNIPVTEVSIAIERLERLGYLRKARNGCLILQTGPLSTLGQNHTTVALRKLQRQILEMAISAMENTDLEDRDQTSITMAISTEKLSRAREMIKDFRRKLSQFLESDTLKLDSVYHFTVSLYPVTQKERRF